MDCSVGVPQLVLSATLTNNMNLVNKSCNWQLILYMIQRITAYRNVTVKNDQSNKRTNIIQCSMYSFFLSTSITNCITPYSPKQFRLYQLYVSLFQEQEQLNCARD